MCGEDHVATEAFSMVLGYWRLLPTLKCTFATGLELGKRKPPAVKRKVSTSGC